VKNLCPKLLNIPCGITLSNIAAKLTLEEELLTAWLYWMLYFLG